METVKLQVNKKIYSKLISLLSQFNSEDLKIIDDTNTTQEYLEKQLENLDKTDAEFISVDQLEAMLENTIVKYEN